MRPLADAVPGFIFFTVPVAGAELPLIVVWLICAGVFFTFYLRLVNIRGFKLFFLTFVVLGSSIQLSALVDLSDALVFVVAIPNLLGLYLMAPLIRRELVGYERRLQQATRP